MKSILRKIIVLLTISAGASSCKDNTPDRNDSLPEQPLIIYAGAASKPPLEEVIERFKLKTGIPVEVIIGSSGHVLSQLKITRKGDIYIPGSSDYMEMAKRDTLVYANTEKIVAYLVNSINVQAGNPKAVKSLKDLCKPGLTIAIAHPENVCLGAYAVEIIEKNFTASEKQQFLTNLRNYTESCEKTASAIALRAVDAVIGWSVFHHWNPQQIENVYLKKEEIARIGYIPVAICRSSVDSTRALKFIEFITGTEGKNIFKKYGYFSDVHEAYTFAGDGKPIGGTYKVPDEWLKK
ncbi:MAG: molybdate ABC transporter substrate-binding protein [Cytophagaceae bacterium]|nr:molybdate ABC transporter substrate-binding protein [Cytophagaceae bacterium]MDW8456620.1 molybdate ABC transporter substrate-binding protein [Cytophagaceae bacterium]